MTEITFKSNRGRPASTTPKDDWHVKVEQELSVYFRSLFYDEFTGQTKKSAMSDLINRLLREEKAKLQGEQSV